MQDREIGTALVMANDDNKLGGTLVLAVAAVLCCALPLLIVTGTLGLWAGWLAGSWPLIVIAVVLLGYGAWTWYRSASRGDRYKKR